MSARPPKPGRRARDARGAAPRRARGGGAGGRRRAPAHAGADAPSSQPPPALARLWAPWRLELILAPSAPRCIFCAFPEAPGSEDRKNLVVRRRAHAFVILNRYPYNSGHLMVVPRAHVDRLEALAPEALAELQAELALAIRVVRETYRPEGINVGMNLGKVAGAGIADHLHWHVVPRWNGDTNFMPVLAETRVMIEHLDHTWSRLRDGYAAAVGA